MSEEKKDFKEYLDRIEINLTLKEQEAVAVLEQEDLNQVMYELMQKIIKRENEIKYHEQRRKELARFKANIRAQARESFKRWHISPESEVAQKFLEKQIKHLEKQYQDVL